MREQIGSVLDLVDEDGWGEALEEETGVARGELPQREIVERGIAPAGLAHAAQESRLADLTRTGHEDRGKLCGGVQHAVLEHSFSVDFVHYDAECYNGRI